MYRAPERAQGQIPHRTLTAIVGAGELPPDPEHSSFRFPRLRRTHKSSVFFFSSITCWYTR